MQTVLITGGLGFIGSALARRLLAGGDFRVVVADIRDDRSALFPAIHPNLHVFKCDVNDRDQVQNVFEQHPPDYVFHYAALTGVKRTLENPLRVLNDIDGIRNFLEFSVTYGVKRVFYSSSSEVYGEPVQIPQHEHTTPLNSRLPYAVVKNVGESYLKSFQTEHKLDYTVFRFFNTYGAGQSQEFVIPRFIRAALAGEPLVIYGEGLQTRTFCHINDNVDAAIAALTGGYFINDVINIGSGNEVAIIDLARMIIRLTGSKSDIQHLPPLKEGDMTRRKPDISRMITMIEREPTEIEAGLEQVIQEIRACAVSTV